VFFYETKKFGSDLSLGLKFVAFFFLELGSFFREIKENSFHHIKLINPSISKKFHDTKEQSFWGMIKVSHYFSASQFKSL